jgi:imidazolonepropionase
MIRKLFRNANIFTPILAPRPASGPKQGEISSYPNSSMLVEDGVILSVGGEEVLEQARIASKTHPLQQEIDLEGAAVVPGFVDAHTHACFSAAREKEFDLRLAGTPYLEILKQGGGILASVERLRATPEEKLTSKTRAQLLRMMSMGTTTIEVKSGYGLNIENEMKSLSAIHAAGLATPLDVVPTFMGAHAVPEEYRKRPDDYVELVIDEMIPAVKRQGFAHFFDVFCEEGVFSPSQSRRLLLAAREAGFGIKVHADEVHDIGGAALAAEMGAHSAEHLLMVSSEGIAAMAKSDTVAVLLPATALSLRKPFARGRKMIENGVPVALATDCNPGSSYCESMAFVFTLGVLGMELSPSEALTATTLNAAWAIGMEQQTGSLEPGKKADFLTLDCETPAGIAYRVGSSILKQVYKNGEPQIG